MAPILPVVAGVAGGMQMFKEVANGLSSVKTQATAAKNYADAIFNNKSLIDIAQVARVEPILIVDAYVVNVDFPSSVVESLHTQFSGYYLQAANLIGTIGGVSLAQRLAPLNPNRVGLESYDRSDWRYAKESYRFRLPTSHNKLAAALEATSFEADMKENTNSIRDAANLSTGKVFNVKVQHEERSANIPVAIRLMASIVPTRSVMSMFTFKDATAMDMKERWHGFRAGRLEFWRDLVLVRDLIDAHRTASIKDKDGVYSQIIGREAGNKRKFFTTGAPSLATASNLAIISRNTADSIEQALHGRLRDMRTRKAMFDNTNLMILAVVDPQWERVEFFYRGIQASTSVKASELKGAGKGNGSEVMDVMKAFIAGNAPHQ